MERERGWQLMEQLNFDFYYGKQAEQFTFYRLPKVLITDKRFKDLSDSAKLLYGLMLDRMSLSVKNGWLDEQNRVYIKYSFSGIMEDLNCAREKASKLLKELEEIGLIWKVTQIGHASIIYVKNFVKSVEDDTNMYDKQTSPKNEQVTEDLENPSRTSTDVEQVRKSNSFENLTSSGTENEQKAVRETNTNNNNSNNTDFNNTNQINRTSSEEVDEDAMDKAIEYMEIIKENIDYDVLMSNKQWRDRDMFDELFQLICEVVCVPAKSVRIGGKDYPYSLVKNRFLKLNASHLEYVIGCMEKNTTKVANIKSYLITALYNAPSTMSHYYTAEVNHDMYGA